MTGDVRKVAKAYAEMKAQREGKTPAKKTLRLPDLELSAHKKLVLRAAKHYLETELTTGKGELLTPEETEMLDDWWLSSVFQMIQAIRFEAEERPAAVE